MNFFIEFYDGLALDKGTRATFIAIIPKVVGATKISKYCPISLVGCLYKVPAKVLAERLKVVLPFIISDCQCAVVAKRQLLDCSLVANEAIDSYLRLGMGGILCKLDMEKAYDRMDWDCLDYLLARMRFGMTLSRLLMKGRMMGLFKGFSIGSENVEVSHLQFADDTLLFCKSKRDQVLNLEASLRCYELITGERSNFQKFRLYALNCPSEEAMDLAKILGCKLDHLPSSYLGLPLGFGRPNKSLWDPIVERIEKRLESWKQNLVSRGGRPVLVMLANIPIYFLSLFKCRVSVALRIEQIQRIFLWEGMMRRTVFHWFRVYVVERIKFWSDVWCAKKPLRGLFPDLYRVASNKEAFVCEYFNRNGGGYGALSS
ncbi:uncharacterized protein LOC143870071 [Tasmannia lanceolata]|uniref:uncharacterized protein LOC143870071 n=1 Tax=Tasmannia lanceolata TaxID=3420 RepID=UPI004063A45F